MDKDYTVWTTRDGRKVRVTDMSNRHIANCITMIRKAGLVTAEEKAALYPGLPPNMQGEYAQMYAEQEWDAEFGRWLDAKVSIHLTVFEMELAMRRKYNVVIHDSPGYGDEGPIAPDQTKSQSSDEPPSSQA